MQITRTIYIMDMMGIYTVDQLFTAGECCSTMLHVVRASISLVLNVLCVYPGY